MRLFTNLFILHAARQGNPQRNDLLALPRVQEPDEWSAEEAQELGLRGRLDVRGLDMPTVPRRQWTRRLAHFAAAFDDTGALSYIFATRNPPVVFTRRRSGRVLRRQRHPPATTLAVYTPLSADPAFVIYTNLTVQPRFGDRRVFVSTIVRLARDPSDNAITFQHLREVFFIDGMDFDGDTVALVWASLTDEAIALDASQGTH